MNFEARTFLWHPASGPAIILTNPADGWRLLADCTGLGMTTYTYTERKTPGRPGATTTSVQANPRDIDLEFIIEARNPAELRGKMQQLIRAMRPSQGPGRLEVIEPSGGSRSIVCKYVDGLEGSEARGVTVPGRWYRGVLGLRADDPYPTSQPITVSWSLTGNGRGWFPIVPIRLSASGIAGRKKVYVPGDLETFPLVRVKGPGEQLVVRHRDTGRALHLDYTIPADGPGSMITIDTRRGAQSIVDGYGTNLFEFVTDEDPSLWSLLPGDNDVEVQLQQTESGASVSMTFDPLHESL